LHVKAIIVEPYHDRRVAEKVARSTDAKVVEFAQFPGGIPNTDTYASLVDKLVSKLADALK
jgi:ABC-type Zn uptake system ZnuABC Zn-binding protein ZnuA